MSEKRYVAPGGMRQAAHDSLAQTSIDDAQGWSAAIDRLLEAALRWLSENPIMPSDAQVTNVLDEANDPGEPMRTLLPALLQEWQRRMFLAPEWQGPDWENPAIPAEVRFQMARKPHTLMNDQQVDAYNAGVLDGWKAFGGQ